MATNLNPNAIVDHSITAVKLADDAIVSDASVAAWGYTKNTGTLTGVTFNNTAATVTNGVAAITATVPAEVTETTVTNWGFTKNAGTVTGVTMNGASNTPDASGDVNLGAVVTEVKTINGSSIVGSGNLNTGQRYINADTVADLPEAAEAYQNAIALIPSTTTSGSIDYYACVYDAVVGGVTVSGWSWVPTGTSSPIVSTQEVDIYGNVVPDDTKSDKSINTTGGEYALTNGTVKVYKNIDLINKKYLVDIGYSASQTGAYSVNFYSAAGNQASWLGGIIINPGGNPLTRFYKIPLSFPDSWTSDVLEQRLSDAVIIKLAGYAVDNPDNQYHRPAELYEAQSINQSVVKKTVTPGQIEIFTSEISLPSLWGGTTSGSQISTSKVQSPWGIVWPKSYSAIGNATPIIAMLHGSDGYVTNGVLGYTDADWVAWRQQYLDAGFAVMDINGYGVSTSADYNALHWGCPAAIETLDKAFEFLKANYNVSSKLLLHGTSMGGALAMSYAKTFPGKVAAVGGFAPNVFALSMRYFAGSGTYSDSKEKAWGYTDTTEAYNDNYRHLTGYIPLTDCQVIDDTTKELSQFNWKDYVNDSNASNHYTNMLTKQLVDSFPVPMRIWGGTADTLVYPSFLRLLVNGLNNGNSNVTLRMCEGATHTNLKSQAYVRNESVEFFKKYVTSSGEASASSTALVSGVTVKTINNQSIVGSGNLNTINGYINVNLDGNNDPDFPTPGAEYQSKIALVPSTTTSGSLDYYICIYGEYDDGGVTTTGWHWSLVGTTSPTISIQETDTLQQLLKWKTLLSYRPTLGTSGNEGNISAASGTNPLSSSIYYIGDADEVYVNFRVLPHSSSHALTIWYYDETLPTCALGSEHAAYLGSAYDRIDNPDSTGAVYTNQRLEIPDGTKYVLIVYTANLYEGNEYDSCKIRVNVSQYVVKKQVTPNVINYFETYVTSPVYNDVSSGSEETTTQNLSAWGIVFPSSYSNVGTPTQIIAMLHGLSGYVTSEVLGYDSTPSWVAWRNKYLDAGFAVLDINGYGVSSSGSDFNSRHYGNPQFVETLDKAFEFLKANYNVCDKLLLHGTSMGGGGAMSYLMNHPNKVNGVGLFAPTLLPYSLRKAEDRSSALVAWGYDTASNAYNDGYKRLVGYAPMMENSFDWTTVDPSNTTNPIASFTSPTKLPNVPIRIWQGTDDATVPYNNTSKLVELLRKGNTQVILRTGPGGTHSISTGTPEYVQNEAVDWFKRYRGGSSDDGGGSYVDTGLPTGGTTGQVLVKKSNNSYDTEWVDLNNGYITADSIANRPTASEEYKSKICLVPASDNSGAMDQYVCVLNGSTWEWQLGGTTSPIVSVQEVDTYQPLISITELPGSFLKSTGVYNAMSSPHTLIFDIDNIDTILCNFTIIGAGTAALFFFDDGLDFNDLSTSGSHYLGWRCDKNVYSVSQNTKFYNQIIHIDSDTTLGPNNQPSSTNGDITGAKYVGLAVLTATTPYFGSVSALTPVPQSLVKKAATPSVIIEFVTTIQKPFVTTMDSATNQEITETNTLSPWAVMFPTSYANIGRPTPVVAMLHGLGGIVTSQVMGYSGTGWVDTRQAYLAAGFAVMDVNGYGVSQESDDNSKHWGNPLSIETLDKAFEYLKENYNVWDKLLIAGISMGSILAMGYAKCFPEKVAAVGCFAPNLFAYSMRYLSGDGSKERAWQYQDHAAANADNYKNLTGYVVLNECQVVDTNGFMKKYEWPASKPADWPTNLADVQLVDSFPVPMRVWQGTSDDQVNPNCSKLLVSALRRGNSTVSLRLCLNVGHDVQNESYVRNEAVSWFKRFVNF